MIKETKKKKAETKIIKKPGKIPVVFERKIPKKAEITPKKIANFLYSFNLLAKFRAEAAGKAVKPATNSPPTNFTPKATISEIESKYKN